MPEQVGSSAATYERVTTSVPGYTYRLRGDVLEIWTQGPMNEPFYSLVIAAPMDQHVIDVLFGEES